MSTVLRATIEQPEPPEPAAAATLDAPALATGILAELTAGLAAGGDLRQLLVQLLQPIARIAGANSGAVRVVDPADGHLHLVGVVGLPQPVWEAEREVERDCGACGAALAAGLPQWSGEIGACVRRNAGLYFGHRGGCQSLLAVPLQHRGRALGVLNLFFDDNSTEPGGDVVALLKTIAELLGLALDNARLEEEKLRAELTAERHAIAADVHDSLGQSLAFVKMRLPLLHDAMQRGDREGAERYFEDVRETVGQAHAGLRVLLAHFLAPPEARGLASALAASAEAFRARGGTTLEMVHMLCELELTPAQEEQVYRIVQEALVNIARHARARHAWVHVERDGETLEVRIEDDGSGLPAHPDGDGSHYGVSIMRERARRLGGTLELGPRAGRGTLVRLRFPLGAAASAANAVTTPTAA